MGAHSRRRDSTRRATESTESTESGKTEHRTSKSKKESHGGTDDQRPEVSNQKSVIRPEDENENDDEDDWGQFFNREWMRKNLNRRAQRNAEIFNRG